MRGPGLLDKIIICEMFRPYFIITTRKLNAHVQYLKPSDKIGQLS